jgi:AcrR family transcriptional regulator
VVDESNGRRLAPVQERARQTYERLLDVTGVLLADAGIENISVNMICARAGVTPPAVYRYFKDKYAVIEALAERHMLRQFAVVEGWLSETLPGGVDGIMANMPVLIERLAGVTSAQAGAVWVMRALRAVPRLGVIRLESHRRVTQRLYEVYAPFYPEVTQERLLTRIRIGVEFTYALDELIAESGPGAAASIIADGGQMIAASFRF